MKWIILLTLLVGCGNDTSVRMRYRTIKGAETVYFVCSVSAPVYSFGAKQKRLEFFGDDAQTQAMEACK